MSLLFDAGSQHLRAWVGYVDTARFLRSHRTTGAWSPGAPCRLGQVRPPARPTATASPVRDRRRHEPSLLDDDRGRRRELPRRALPRRPPQRTPDPPRLGDAAHAQAGRRSTAPSRARCAPSSGWPTSRSSTRSSTASSARPRRRCGCSTSATGHREVRARHAAAARRHGHVLAHGLGHRAREAATPEGLPARAGGQPGLPPRHAPPVPRLRFRALPAEAVHPRPQLRPGQSLPPALDPEPRRGNERSGQRNGSRSKRFGPTSRR